MRRTAILIILVLALMATSVPAALAHNGGPCHDSGEPGSSDYARHHIVPADLGSGGHKPGAHRGFSFYIAQAGWKTHP